MRILMLCAGGMSSSIVVKKLRRYAAEHGLDVEIKATGVGSYKETCNDYDCVLLAPQAKYYLKRVREYCAHPVALIEPADYGIGNAENIFKQVGRMVEATA